MISGRRAAREAALLILFAVDANADQEPDRALSDFRDHFRDDADVLEALYAQELAIEDQKQLAKAMKVLADDGPRWAFVERLVRGTLGHVNALDEMIARCSLNWKVPRMGIVDRNILRLAAFELAFEADVPSRVTLNEGIELAKRYGSEESGAFVNGILDRIAQELGRVGGRD